jgi:hypothetical protein
MSGYAPKIGGGVPVALRRIRFTSWSRPWKHGFTLTKKRFGSIMAEASGWL